MNEHQTRTATVAAYRTSHQLECVVVANQRLQSLCHYFVWPNQCQIEDLSKIFSRTQVVFTHLLGSQLLLRSIWTSRKLNHDRSLSSGTRNIGWISHWKLCCSSGTSQQSFSLLLHIFDIKPMHFCHREKRRKVMSTLVVGPWIMGFHSWKRFNMLLYLLRVIFFGLFECFPRMSFGAQIVDDEACAIRLTRDSDTPCRLANSFWHTRSLNRHRQHKPTMCMYVHV